MNTLTHLFDWLLAASLRASLLTLVTLLIQAAVHRHLGARMRYALWLPTLIVLLMPVLPQSRWSIERVFQSPAPEVNLSPLPVSPVTTNSETVVFEAPAPHVEPIPWERLFLVAWAVIAASMLLLGSFSFILTLRRFKHLRHPVRKELLDTLAQIASEVRLSCVPRVLIAPAVSSPAVTGLLRPTLLLPAEFDHEFTPAEARLVLKHELMHIKRGDLPLNALMCVLMALHWFNPLLWIAFFKVRADREAACDAQVLHDAPSERRIAYGHALLKVETAFCPRGLSLGFVGIFQRGAALRSRIRSIAAHRNTHPVMKSLLMLCMVVMTFFGITRAQQPKPAEDAPLIALEIKIIEFKKATDWNFGGRLPPEETLSFLYSEMSPEDLAVQLREAMKSDDSSATSYPRIVTADKKEVVVKSVVNTPVKGTYLPIGLVLKLTPALHGTHVGLNIDITDSDLIDPATGAVISELKGDYPTARSRVYNGNHEIRDGHCCVIAGWENGKPQSKLPLIYVITPHVIDPKKGGLPAGMNLTSELTVGKSAFRPGDSIVITSMSRSDDVLTIGLDYELASTDQAVAGLYFKSAPGSEPPPFNAGQNMLVNRGRGSVTLRHSIPSEGLPHVLLYDAKTRAPLGGVYFGDAEQAARSQTLDLSYLTASAPKAAAPSTNEKGSELVITAETISTDRQGEIQTAAGNAMCEVPGMSVKAQELVYDRKARQLTIRGPFSILMGSGIKHSSTSSSASAVVDLSTGKLTTSGRHETEMPTLPTGKIVPSSVAGVPAKKDEIPAAAANGAEFKAAELRKAPAQQYDFSKASLGDVLRFVATDARIDFFALPDDNPVNQRLVTFSIRSSPFELLETLCRANDLVLMLDHERWFIRPSEDSAMVERAYALPQTQAGIDIILKDISLLLGDQEARPGADAAKPSVTYSKEKNAFLVKASRVQQTWVGGYFRGLAGGAQAGKTR
ncbi:M56 family metallopeptidase [Prosthecobacter sp.]|uniref:M56 family metallopeptidase n=1 Tax=Prosthecobacter sp. TaxID=1965333 RepID=UPI0037848B5E